MSLLLLLRPSTGAVAVHVSGVGPITYALAQNNPGAARDDGSDVLEGLVDTEGPRVSGAGGVATSNIAINHAPRGSAR